MQRHLKIILRFILLIVLPTIAIGGGADYWLKSTRYVKTENAYVKSHHLAVSADIDGRASKILVQENDHVNTGDLLFTLDPEPYRINVSKAEAELAGIRNTLRALRAEYHQVVAERVEAQQEVLYLERVFARHKKLSARGISSKARYDEAERNLIKARQSFRSLKQKMLHVIARLGGRHDTPDKMHPMFMAAKAKLDGATLNLRRTQIRSPSNGTVGKVSLQVGEYVEEGKAVIPIIQTAEIWVEANLKETQLTYVKPKQSVLLTVDAYPEVLRALGTTVLEPEADKLIAAAVKAALQDKSPGVYLLDVLSNEHFFSQVKISLPASPVEKVRCLEYKFPGSPKAPIAYPLHLAAHARARYFEKREKMGLHTFFRNPTSYMMVVMVLVVIFMPKMMANMDKDQLKEMQDQMSGNDPQELLNNLFGGGKKNDDDD